MFSYMNMAGDYKQRLVANYKSGDLVIDTCRVTDSDKPFETAIKHPKYNNGDWVVVELYDTKELAQEGHDRWIERMKDVPKELKDVCAAEVAKIKDIFTGTAWRVKKPI